MYQHQCISTSASAIVHQHRCIILIINSVSSSSVHHQFIIIISELVHHHHQCIIVTAPSWVHHRQCIMICASVQWIVDPSPRICSGVEVAHPGSEHLRKLRHKIGLIFLPYQPDSRDCIIFNTQTLHLNYEWHCERLIWECSEPEPLTKEAGIGTFHRPQEPAKSLWACKSMFFRVSKGHARVCLLKCASLLVKLRRGSESERISDIADDCTWFVLVHQNSENCFLSHF